MGKVFVIDVEKCVGCHNCQIACKDEHCNQPWPPYTEAQPEVGQFWMDVRERERGKVPWVKVSYLPFIGAQDEAIRTYAPEAIMKRDDNLIVIDPKTAKGRKDLAERFDGVFWNDELDIPQGCTGCAHLLDDGWSVPRCVDSCPTDALLFGDADDFTAQIATSEKLSETSNVYYFNLPKRFIAGTFVDFSADEVVIGAKADLVNSDGIVIETIKTDDFGDFIFPRIEAGSYLVRITAEGFTETEIEADATAADISLGNIAAVRES